MRTPKEKWCIGCHDLLKSEWHEHPPTVKKSSAVYWCLNENCGNYFSLMAGGFESKPVDKTE